MAEPVFVSYSHEEDVWRERFRQTIGSGVYEKAFRLWFDTSIAAGADWAAGINDAIATARIALLLVGQGFLNSRFIAEKELPTILKRRLAERVTILWVPIDAIPHNVLETAGLHAIQAVWPPDKPLSKLSEEELGEAFMQIASNLIQTIKVLDRTSPAFRDELRPKVAQMMPEGTVLGEPFASGDYTIFYRAKQRDRDVAVKVLVPAPGREWLSKDFIRRATIVQKITNSTAIEIRDVLADARVHCVVMDFINAPTLESRLKQEGKLKPELVADVLAQLVRLAGHLHQLDGRPIIGPVRPSHVHYDSSKPKAFISLVAIANETLESCRDDPTRLQDSEALPYLSPERYYGRRVDDRSDQYYLALLGLELLQGRPPVRVRRFADLQAKADFFRSPASHFDVALRREQPAFSFILARMLEQEPQQRWSSMSELESALRQLAEGAVPQAVKCYADEQYNEVLGEDFFRAFYDNLFERSSEIRGMFTAVTLEEQAGKLKDAMENILYFTRDLKTSILRRQVQRHLDRGIKAEHFALFRDAFLDALRATHEPDEYAQDAWRAVLDPALSYMRDEISRESS